MVDPQAALGQKVQDSLTRVDDILDAHTSGTGSGSAFSNTALEDSELRQGADRLDYLIRGAPSNNPFVAPGEAGGEPARTVPTSELVTPAENPVHSTQPNVSPTVSLVPEPLTALASSTLQPATEPLNLRRPVPPPPSEPEYAPGGQVRLTKSPTIKNAVLPAEGNGYFSNVQLALAIFFFPAILLRLLPFVKSRWISWPFYLVLVALFGVPVTIAYWTLASMYGPRINEKVTLPGRPIEYYLDIKDPDLRRRYNGHNKIPMEIFYENYFDGKIDVKGDILDVLENRWDWAAMHFTPGLFKYVLFHMLPDVLMHSERQDETQIRDNYDRGDDFHEWFLGPQMIYTSGIIGDPNREETLEELQDNKLNLVCSKLALEPNDRVLDIGCGWGTLAAFAAKNYGANVTGVTLSRNQAKFGNERIARNGISPDQARVVCQDYRDIPVNPGYFNKIVALEMAEHVGIRHYSKFLNSVYNLLADDGVMVFQVAGLRPRWQYWDLIWGLFMNKYIFPGADASCPLNWVIRQLEVAGFEIRSVDVVGVHYSATIDRWLKNWRTHEDECRTKYGDRLWRIWLFFLASSIIVAREGGSSLFQITVTKNVRATCLPSLMPPRVLTLSHRKGYVFCFCSPGSCSTPQQRQDVLECVPLESVALSLPMVIIALANAEAASCQKLHGCESRLTGGAA